MVVIPGCVFVDAEIRERMQWPPGEEAARELGLPTGMLPPDRWLLRVIRASIPALASYSLEGVRRACLRAGVRLRRARPRQFSPDPAYVAKQAAICAALREMAAAPEEVVVVFLDEMGIVRHPLPTTTFALGPPAPVPRTTPAGKEAKHRIAGMLDACTGRVLTVDGHDAGTDRLAQLYRTLDRTYPFASRIYVIQDNWPVHTAPRLIAELARLPRIRQLFLPLGAHWLNPIEKLWRKLRQEVLYLHRLADDWLELRRMVRRFLQQFRDGSQDLLYAVGLLGDGLLARARRGHLPITDPLS